MDALVYIFFGDAEDAAPNTVSGVASTVITELAVPALAAWRDTFEASRM